MQSCALSKLICHRCKRESVYGLLVSCKTPGCNHFFCHCCLTSRYKYSKAKVSKLPTAHWKCPVCAQRCQCDECIESGTVAPIKKRVMKRKEVPRRHRRKKRIRKAVFQIQSNTGTRTPPSERETNEFLSPVVHRLIPPISAFLAATSRFYEEPRVAEILPICAYEAMSVATLLRIASGPLINY